ncbi:MAG: ATP-dependent RecD-like DNA helicase [Candidatus Xenobiia bacterium LiM19]
MASSQNKENYAFHHLSLRVPWHDNGWNGSVCSRPSQNAACLVLDNIREKKLDDREDDYAAEDLRDLTLEELPPCCNERGFFMAPFEIILEKEHPYSKWSPIHKHILRTDFKVPPYSAPAVPFRWMNSKSCWDIANEHMLPCQREWEPKLDFHTTWVQDYRNQKLLLDRFFSFIRPVKSLCFFYAKDTPLSDMQRRVIIGVGRVTELGKHVEYNYKKNSQDELKNIIWERVVQHSIRPESEDGFLLPYHAVLERASEDPDIDPSEYLACVPSESLSEFSYTAEHVSHDAAIAALLACRSALEKASTIISGSFSKQLKWIDDRLSELWRFRGPCPGLGAALAAFGVEFGNLLAFELSPFLAENEDPWPLVDRAMKEPESISKICSQYVDESIREIWSNLPDERRVMLKLISRFELNNDQAAIVYEPSERKKRGIECSDRDIIENPYLLYEKTRFVLEAINVFIVDRGMYPDAIVEEKNPIPEPSAHKGILDKRRVKALMINTLEYEASCGNTIVPEEDLLNTIRSLSLTRPCPISIDVLCAYADDLGPNIRPALMKDGKRAYKLTELYEMASIICKTVKKRLKAKTIVLSDFDWEKELAAKLPDGTVLDENEKMARSEKIEALIMLSTSRFSVLIGPAGTGKTTLLSVLCAHPDIKNGGILLLAPTGKARVRLQVETRMKGAKTIAQFLRSVGRYDETVQRYFISPAPPHTGEKTVIIDEASMLTEVQLGALLDGIRDVERLILVGDPCQLPPIGPGRPFVDIVNYITPEGIENSFPRVGKCFAELTIRTRQKGLKLDDLRLAEWFSARDPGPGADEIFEIILNNSSERLSHVEWSGSDEIQEKLLEVLVKELQLKGKDDWKGFERSLGAIEDRKGTLRFVKGQTAEKSASWQILTPVRGYSYGVADINRMIQRIFRSHTLQLARKRSLRERKIPGPLGPDNIVYGDKVISTVNNYRDNVNPEENSLCYVANGEIGIAVGKYVDDSQIEYGELPLEIEFSSQPNYEYQYGSRDFQNEIRGSALELAYAITVHKAQGSEFKRSVVIIPKPCRNLSRELIYTALTRQRDHLVILHQDSLLDLKDFASSEYSETARRLTDLFEPPLMLKIGKGFFENRLIHRSEKGESMRSKSEVIIANMLSSRGIFYSYEKEFVGADGVVKYPDFTIVDADSGTTYIWEHLGMLTDHGYRKDWQRKLEWYLKQGLATPDDGGGPRGTLLITEDYPDGGLDSEKIAHLIDSLFEAE